MGKERKLTERVDKPVSKLSCEELSGEKAKLSEYREWHEKEGKQYFDSLGKIVFEPELPEDEMLNFKYLQAVYSLNAFSGCRIRPAGYFETSNEKICAGVIERGGDILAMYHAGADAVYCALLSDPLTDKEIFLKTVERHIPF
jgi:hypothetical protein